MIKQERELLTNLLNSLDRLWDRDNQVVDLHDLLLATAQALAETRHSPQLQTSLEIAQAVLRSTKPLDLKRDACINETQSLREYLNDVLYRDSPRAS